MSSWRPVTAQTSVTKTTADSVVGAVFVPIGEMLVRSQKISTAGLRPRPLRRVSASRTASIVRSRYATARSRRNHAAPCTAGS